MVHQKAGPKQNVLLYLTDESPQCPKSYHDYRSPNLGKGLMESTKNITALDYTIDFNSYLHPDQSEKNLQTKFATLVIQHCLAGLELSSRSCS